MTTATATDYGARSSARRAAKAAGLDPDKVHQLASGRWALPASEGTAPEADDGLDIPDFLRVENHRPLTPEQQERVQTMLTQTRGATEASDLRKPKGMSAEDWVALEAARAEKRKIKARNRIAKMLAKKNPKPVSLDRHPRADGKRRICWQGDPTYQGTVVTEGERPIVRWDNGNETEVEEAWVAPIPTEKPPAPPPPPKAAKRSTPREPRQPRTEGGARVIGYKGHLAGSRKARVHECYDAKGVEAAIQLAADLGLKSGTAWAWAKAWAKADGGVPPSPATPGASVGKKRR